MVARNLTISLDASLAAALERRAVDTGRSVEDVALSALRRGVDGGEGEGDAGAAEGAEGESVADAFRRLGLLGCIDGLPPDLSTNPKYMEGFGE